MEEELGSGKARTNTVNLGGGDSDGEGVEEEEDDLEMTKYDEGEVAVNEEDELAVSFRVHRKERSDVLIFKHCQRHNGPEGKVHITSSKANVYQISSSESRPSINFKISTKHQPLHKS